MNIKGKHQHQLLRSACAGKKRFDSFAEADRYMRAVIFKMGDSNPPMSAYLCDFCDGWHFGRTPTRRPAINDLKFESPKECD